MILDRLKGKPPAPRPDHQMLLPVSGEKTMQDKRLIHELLQHQYPALHEQLRAGRCLRSSTATRSR
jgi:hypothetical protein